MEYLKDYPILIIGIDGGMNNSVEPENREGCVGCRGIDKNYTFEMVLKLAYSMNNKPNVIVKSGKKGKWYLKCIEKDLIEDLKKYKFEKPEWRNTSNCDLYIIPWK